MLELIRGNKRTLQWHLTEDGEDLDNIADATKITFAIKRTQTEDDTPGADKVILTWENGQPQTTFKLDTPESGWVTVDLTSDHMDISPGEYYIALQLEWGTSAKLEFTTAEGRVTVLQDTIR
jgi:hypothetical protein